MFRGLRESGMLAHMRRNGVRCLDVHAVEDNIMAKIADPIFLGKRGRPLATSSCEEHSAATCKLHLVILVFVSHLSY